MAYSATLRPEAWREVGERLSHALGGAVAVCCHRGPDTEVVHFAGEIDRAVAYEGYYHRFDSLLQRILETPGPAACTEADVPDLSDVFIHDYLRRFGDRHMMYAGAPMADGAILIGAVRTARAGAFDGPARQLATQLAPHLARARGLMARAADVLTGFGALEQTLELSGTAVALVDGAGRLVFRSPAAERLADAGVLSLSGERLELGDVAAANDLRRAIARATERLPRRPTTLEAPHPHGALRIRVLPFEERQARSLALLLFDAPKRAPGDALSTRYGLTAAETRLLVALADGERLAAYAEGCGIALSTAKTHLLSLFAKTQTNRQADLVRLAVTARL